MVKAKSSRRLQEKTVQNFLEWFFIQKGFEVKREVKTPVGFIDLIIYQTSSEWHRQGRKILIEVKERAALKGAIGQLYSYEKYQNCTEKWVIYFCRDGINKSIDSSYYDHKEIKFNSVHSITDLETIESFDRKSKEVNYGELWLSEENQKLQESPDLLMEMIPMSSIDLEMERITSSF